MKCRRMKASPEFIDEGGARMKTPVNAYTKKLTSIAVRSSGKLGSVMAREGWSRALSNSRRIGVVKYGYIGHFGAVMFLGSVAWHKVTYTGCRS